jgi:pimeloyl-ACP methyl ester carboxylesterase
LLRASSARRSAGANERRIYGITDVLSPAQHGEWLGRNVPNAEVVIQQESGHLPDPAVITEHYAWLVRQN